MLYMKRIVMGVGLSCVLLSAPTLVHANTVETKTFKNNVPGGAAATDLKIASNRHPFAAINPCRCFAGTIRLKSKI